MPESQGSSGLPGILATIVERKREELSGLAAGRRELERAAAAAPPARDFGAALRREESVALIAECKRRSPGAGEIRPGLDPAALARAYEGAGAAALSVLTDGPFFGGSGVDLERARASIRIPVLRKDFTLDPLQVLEARAMGADAVLLIVRILSDADLTRLLEAVRGLGMSALVEAHDGTEVERALGAGARIVGINNRDLATFTTDLSTTVSLLDRIPNDVTVVSESGIRGPGDVRVLGQAGVDAVLVGETLLRAESPAAVAAALSAVPRRKRSRG